MNPKLKEKLMESLTAVLPITLIVLALSVVLVPMDVGTAVMFTVGAVLLVFGMGLFQLGAEMAMSPLGEGIGVQMERVKKIPVIVAIAFVMGVIITIAEPDLQVLAQQVPSIPNKVLIYSIAVGVGAFLALAVVRILKRISLSKLLLALYGLLAVVSVFVPESFLAVAYDSGGVTTGADYRSVHHGDGRGHGGGAWRQRRGERQFRSGRAFQRRPHSGGAAARLFL